MNYVAVLGMLCVIGMGQITTMFSLSVLAVLFAPIDAVVNQAGDTDSSRVFLFTLVQECPPWNINCVHCATVAVHQVFYYIFRFSM